MKAPLLFLITGLQIKKAYCLGNPAERNDPPYYITTFCLSQPPIFKLISRQKNPSLRKEEGVFQFWGFGGLYPEGW
jgi:hypothetical protein